MHTDYRALVRSGAGEVAIDPSTTALLVVDVANDVLHPDGAFAKNPNLDRSVYQDSLAPLLNLVDAFRAAGRPWIAVTSAYDGAYVPPPMGAALDRMGILGDASPKGAWGSDLLDDLIQRQPDYRVLKAHFSPFAQTAIAWQPGADEDLDAYLNSSQTADETRKLTGSPTLIDLFDSASRLPADNTQQHISTGGAASLHGLLTSLGVDTLVIAGGATHVCQDAAVSSASELGYRVVEPIDACGSEDPEKHWMYLHNHGCFKTEHCLAASLVEQLTPKD